MNPRTSMALLKTAFTKQMYRQLRLAAISHAKAGPAECPACNYSGRFGPFGMPVRSGVMCPKRWSLERQRQLILAIQDDRIRLASRDIIHFAPEWGLIEAIRHKDPKSYLRSDFEHGLELKLNLEKRDSPDELVDVIIANHVLEHVDDVKAFAEIYRVLRSDGDLICMVPIIEGWSETYEDPTITSPVERELHFGQFDHVRYYGRDFRDRILEAGFDLHEITATPAEVRRHRLMRGETIFIGHKATEVRL